MSGEATCALSLATKLHRHTWCSTEGLSGVMHTTRGTVAGVPLADLAYNAAMARVLKTLRRRLREAGLTESVPGHVDVTSVRPDADAVGETLYLHDVSYVDDGVIPIYASADAITGKLALVTAISVDVFQRYGMTLNFKPGKSEALIQWRGPGSEKARRRLTVHEDNLVHCVAPRSDPVDLRIVSLYQHLGTKTAVCAQVAHEVAHRTTCMRAEMHRLWGRILANPRIEQERRLRIAECYVLSKGFFQASTWPNLHGRDFRRLHRSGGMADDWGGWQGMKWRHE